jgi:hypothetical protein
LRAAALLATACALAFVSAFGLGRAVSTTGATHEAEALNLAAAATVPTPVPTRLAPAQAIGAMLPVVIVHPRAKPPARRAAPLARLPQTQILPASQSAPSQSVSTPTSESTPAVSNPEPASSAPAPSKTRAAPKGGGGTSFDSSG